MVKGYHQIELALREGPKTAFRTKQGQWEYRRLPFGLKTAPATFKKMMELDIEWANRYTPFCYLDNIVIYARSPADHNTKL
jgi:hypothetical protein